MPVTVRRWQRREAAEGRWGSLTKGGITKLVTVRHGYDGPSCRFVVKINEVIPVPRFQELKYLETRPSTDGCAYDGPTRVSFQNTSTLGIWVLDQFSDLHDEPAGRTVIAMTDCHNLRNPTLVRLPHLPSAASLHCHLRTVTSTTDRHKLRRWSLLQFSLKISAFSFGQISCKTKRKLY